jgi:adenine-specific DNA-methyltransferase
MPPTKRTPKPRTAESYQHPEADSPMRPEVGTQAQFRKKKPPQKYRYDSSLSPSMEWDGQNPGREEGEALLAEARDKNSEIRKLLAALKKIDTASLPQPAKEALKKTIGEIEAALAAGSGSLERLKAVSGPFLNWSGKAERLSFDVPTLPLFIHERLSTKAIIETLKGHKSDKQEDFFRELWGDPHHSVTDQVLRAYEYRDDWVNRMMLGDSLVAMNSLLRYESLGGQVQMIYLDPPYGVKFGSNFQPFVKKKPDGSSARDVAHNDDEDMTREPEMVQAYRDTWELGLHSYLTYLRDRLLLARELLHPSGSIFVQISDENLHHVREVMEEVFGTENFIVTILLKKKGSQKGGTLDPINDYVVWFAKDKDRAKSRIKKLFLQFPEQELAEMFRYVQLPDGRELTLSDLSNEKDVDYRMFPRRIEADFRGAKLFASENLTSGGYRRTQSVLYAYKGVKYDPGIAKGNCWKHSAITDDGSPSGLDKLAEAGRLFVGDKQLRYKRFASDFGFTEVTNWWDEFGGASNPLYVVQTNTEVVKRCILLTTDPGDLVLDPTCGSGTTAYVAEQWGRRWITMDTSRVPLALARQRLLTATFPYYELKDEERGPAGGFVYKRKQNSKGEEVGGIVPHITSSTIANNEPPAEEVLVDRPELNNSIVRVTGPFAFEATIPTPVDWEGDGEEDSGAISKEDYGSFVDRMIEVLRKSPVLRLEGNRTVQLKNIRPPAKTLSLSAEALVGRSVDQHASHTVYFLKELLRGNPLNFNGKPVPFEQVATPKNDSGVIALDSEKDSDLIAFLMGKWTKQAGGIVRLTADEYGSCRKGKIPDSFALVGERNAEAGPDNAQAVAIVFGPENGAVSEKLVYEAAREAHAKNYTHLYVIGFAIQPNARELVEKCHEVVGVAATYVQATPDLMMGNLLKNMRSSQIFSVCGLPEIKLSKLSGQKSRVNYKDKNETQYQVELLGLDVFEPVSMEVNHQSGNDVPAWFLDTDYNGLCFHVSQAFFPRTGAWENLKKALKGDYEESVWDHLAGTTSAPFAAGEHGQIAVKVIDQRGNELLVVKSLAEKRGEA